MEVFTLAPFSCLSHVAHFQELSNSFILKYTIFVIFMALLQILSFSSGLAIQETSKNSSCPGSIVFQAIWLSLSFITAIIPHDTSRSHQKQPSDYMNFPEPELPIIQSELASAWWTSSSSSECPYIPHLSLSASAAPLPGNALPTPQYPTQLAWLAGVAFSLHFFPFFTSCMILVIFNLAHFPSCSSFISSIERLANHTFPQYPPNVLLTMQHSSTSCAHTHTCNKNSRINSYFWICNTLMCFI